MPCITRRQQNRGRSRIYCRRRRASESVRKGGLLIFDCVLALLQYNVCSFVLMGWRRVRVIEVLPVLDGVVQ